MDARARVPRSCSRGRRAEKRALRTVVCDPRRSVTVRDLRGRHAAGALYPLRVSRESEVAATVAPVPARRRCAQARAKGNRGAFPHGTRLARGGSSERPRRPTRCGAHRRRAQPESARGDWHPSAAAALGTPHNRGDFRPC